MVDKKIKGERKAQRHKGEEKPRNRSERRGQQRKARRPRGKEGRVRFDGLVCDAGEQAHTM